VTTLLGLCTLALQDCGLAAPSQLIGNNDETAIRVIAAAQLAGKSLYKAPQAGWVDSIREYTFSTVALAQQSGSVANSGAGGVAVISGLATTAGMASSGWYAFGTGLPGNSLVTGVTSSTVTINQPASTLGAGQYVFGQSDYPLPSDFRYVISETLWDRSRFWSLRGPMSPQQWQLYKSSVIGRASIQRRWRIRYENGAQVFSVDPVPTDNGAALVLEYVSSAWCQSLSGAPQALWLADTDTPILDDELMTLGVRWRVKRGLGFAYNEELDEYEREFRKAIARDGGAPILNMTPSNHLTVIGPWNIPESGFGGVVGS
jgi:hypothetical protein